MIATLPMYDRPETQAANDRFYSLFRESFPNAPKQIMRDATHWLDRDLLLSQTCSLPYRAVLHTDVNIVATPIHNLPCPAGMYYSAIVTRGDDARDTFEAFMGATLAINSRLSQSGWAAIDDLARGRGVTFGNVIETGSHQASARAVAEGAADIAAIDAVSWTMIQRWDDFANHLRVLENTSPTPALPYITALSNSVEEVQRALVAAVQALSADDKDTLCLNGIADVPVAHYLSMPIPPPPPCLQSEIA